jgi:hypothetical protein
VNGTRRELWRAARRTVADSQAISPVSTFYRGGGDGTGTGYLCFNDGSFAVPVGAAESRQLRRWVGETRRFSSGRKTS